MIYVVTRADHDSVVCEVCALYGVVYDEVFGGAYADAGASLGDACCAEYWCDDASGDACFDDVYASDSGAASCGYYDG